MECHLSLLSNQVSDWEQSDQVISLPIHCHFPATNHFDCVSEVEVLTEFCNL